MFRVIKSQKTSELWDYTPEKLLGFLVFWHGAILGAIITRYFCDLGREGQGLIQLPTHLFSSRSPLPPLFRFHSLTSSVSPPPVCDSVHPGSHGSCPPDSGLCSEVIFRALPWPLQIKQHPTPSVVPSVPFPALGFSTKLTVRVL